MTQAIGFPVGQAGQAASTGRPVNIVWGTDGDFIEYSESRGRPGVVEINFSVDHRITWWKGLEVRAHNGAVINVLETHDQNKGPYTCILDSLLGNLNFYSIRLLKAKMFGIHTAMYDIGSPKGERNSNSRLNDKLGKRLFFHWVKDGS